MEAVTTDLLLVRCRLPSPAGLGGAAQEFCAARGLRLQRAAWAEGSGWSYVYAELPAPATLARTELAELATSWTAGCPQAESVDVSRLQRLQDLPGRSSGGVATRHYVVETDPEAGWDEELARWYAQEHMPGLAAVPGCIHAWRYLNLDGGPRSHACYALEHEGVLGCPPWLAVRGTGWSSRVRPHFTNTRRTMMQVLAP